MAEQKEQQHDQQHESGEQGSRFEGEFDAKRAERLIENLRNELREVKEERNTLRESAQEREDAEKSEVERLKSALERAENETKSAKHALAVSKAQAKYGLSDEDAEEFLSGLDDEEKILARAERLASRLGTGSQEENGGEGDGEGGEEDGGDESRDLPGKPKPGLTPGTGGSDGGGGIDEDALLAGARERRGY